MNAALGDPEIEFLTSGEVSESDVERAGQLLRDVLRRGAEPVRSVRVTLSVVADPAVPRPALAQAIVDLGTRRVRAQAAATSLDDAVDLLQTRLQLRQAS